MFEILDISSMHTIGSYRSIDFIDCDQARWVRDQDGTFFVSFSTSESDSEIFVLELGKEALSTRLLLSLPNLGLANDLVILSHAWDPQYR